MKGRGRLLLAAVVSVGATSLASIDVAASAESRPALPATTLTARVINLGTLATTSQAKAVDGSVVVGTSRAPGRTRHAFVYDLADPAPRMRDLGDLGGGHSEAVDVSGQIVAGNSLTSAGAQHAFAYDLSTSTRRDLGTLGGARSTAVAVSGSVVVGSSVTADGHQHAFAYDVSTATMHDLGTLGGDSSTAAAVDGRVVVGTSSTPTSAAHAFAYDLSASAMRDLGTLGGDTSVAEDVRGSLVVGRATTGNGHGHAFAYDLASAGESMRDLGALESSSRATGVSGSVVAATSEVDQSFGRAAVFDLSGSSARLQNLGTLGGLHSESVAVSGRLVVGNATRAADNQYRAFAYDVDLPAPAITDLGTIGGTVATVADVDGNVAVGWSTAASGSQRATAWIIRRTAAPSLRFSGLRYAVPESARRATVTVLRAGSRTRAVSVTYRATGSLATAGKDFRAVSGVLRFAAGQTRRSFTVPILNDTRREPAETILLTLQSPRRGAVLGTPNAAALVIRASDQRPDALVASPADDRYVGNNVYSTTGAGETRTTSAHRAQTRVFPVLVTNDGNANSTFVLRGSGSRPGANVRYLTGDRDITAEMRSAAGWHVPLSPKGSHDLTVRITPRQSAKVSSVQTATVSATWRGDGSRVDVVKARVRVVR